ncbi:MAG: T9SS type A sorting domain-containing protein [candidate division WOR-3 bacterium]|nr:T9SS type A sorting domain-containing protein [candidate division WOR-3 bacterium]
MKKITAVICVGVLLFAGVAMGQQWEFERIFYDFGMPIDDSYGIHGVVVAPDGNIWLALHGGITSDPVIDPATGDTLGYYRPVYILDPTTGEHVSFSPLKVLELPDGTLDTIWTESAWNGSGKGISLDNDGNILLTSWSTVYRINYQTGKCMNRFTPTDKASMTEAVQDASGNIYVGYVGSGRPLYILDNDFNLVGNAIDSVGYINRTLAVTPDGKDLYTGSTWNGRGIIHWHSDIPGVLSYTIVDTLGNWDSVYVEEADTAYWEYDVKLWVECLDWDPDGKLWAGGTKEEWTVPGTGSGWFVFDVTTGERLYSIGFPSTDPAQAYEGGMMTPRGAAWTDDGKTAYLADYNFGTVGVWKKSVGVWIKGELPKDYVYDGVFDTTVSMPHGIVVDQHNRIWTGCYGHVALSVRNPDGTEAPISPIDTIIIGTDTIVLSEGRCRGMAVAGDGNILYCNTADLLKINAETGEGMAKWTGAGSLTKPGVDAEGHIFVGTVVGVSPVSMLAPDFTLITEIELTPHPGYARGIEVSADGKDLWTGNLSAGGPVYQYHSDIPGVTGYEIADSIYIDADGDPIFQFAITTLDRGPDGTLWASHETEDVALQSENGLVVFNYATNEYATLYMPEVGEGEFNGPRGVAFSVTGDTAYVASFNGSVVYRYVAGAPGIEDRPIPETASAYKLSQNYPNPFNSTTTISFTLLKHGFVELKVFDVAGREVTTLISQPMDVGNYRVPFDASNLASGIYYYRMTLDGQATTKKMLLVK